MARGRRHQRRHFMRTLFAILVGVLASATADTARADQYKWCALYNFGETGGGANCYFVTQQQCEWAVSGVGGFCAPSPFAGNLPAGTQAQPQTQPRTPAQRKRT